MDLSRFGPSVNPLAAALATPNGPSPMGAPQAQPTSGYPGVGGVAGSPGGLMGSPIGGAPPVMFPGGYGPSGPAPLMGSAIPTPPSPLDPRAGSVPFGFGTMLGRPQGY